MLGKAIIITITFAFLHLLENFTGFQAIKRPIILGSAIGIVCGDAYTGITLGAQLEAAYLGVAMIGGAASIDYSKATVICIGLVILSGVDFGTGLALATPATIITSQLSSFTSAIPVMMHPIFEKLASKYEYKKFHALMFIQSCITSLPQILGIFICVYGGSEIVEVMVKYVPTFVLNGLTAASNMLVCVGLAVIARSIWSGIGSVAFIFLGFVLNAYLELKTLAVAIIGCVFVYMFIALSKRGGSKEVTEDDSFYG